MARALDIEIEDLSAQAPPFPFEVLPDSQELRDE